MKILDEFTDSVVSILTRFGYSVQTEVALPNGRGAIDVLATSPRGDKLGLELKSSPSTLNNPKIARQLSRYSEVNGCGNLGLISPDASGTPRLELLSSDYKGSLADYLVSF